jgi:O-antigen/teichoic acid export membrane protein
LIGETVGLWYLHNYISIAENRQIAAEWIYQFSIIICMVTVITVPYNAVIIAHERMSAFAYISIIEGILKLSVALALPFISSDKLIVYGFSLMLVAIINRFTNGIYSNKHFTETKFKFHLDFLLVKNMARFAGWSLFGSLAAAGLTQGLNLLLNAFFNPAVNAARGIAVTVQSIIRNFSNNFQVAVNPQITKSYANNNLDYLHKLVFNSSRFSFYVLFALSLPIFLEIKFLLSVWLVNVPLYTVDFIRIMMIISCIEVLSSPLNVSIQATGNIRVCEIATSLILLCVVPVSYCVLNFLYLSPQIVFIINLLFVIFAYLVRIFIAQRMISLSIRKYFFCVLCKIALVILSSIVIPLLFFLFIDSVWMKLLTVILSSVICVAVSVYFIGIDRIERKYLKNRLILIKNKLS